MKLGKIHVSQKGALSLSCLNFCAVCFFIVRVGSVHHELLGYAVWLNNDVFDVKLLISNLDSLPGIALVPTDLDLISWYFFLGDDNKTTVVSNFVNIDSILCRLPGEASIS